MATQCHCHLMEQWIKIYLEHVRNKAHKNSANCSKVYDKRVIKNINAKDWKSDTSCVTTTEYRKGVIITINKGYFHCFWSGSF